MVLIKGAFRRLNGLRTTKLNVGDVIAFDSEHKCIAFIRPNSRSQFGIAGGMPISPYADKLHFSSKLDIADFWNIITLLTAATGLIAEETKDYASYKWAYRFVK